MYTYVTNNKDKDMAFYSFKQNNSGGYFLIDDVVSVHIVIEETTMKKAIKKARSITKKHREFCYCCGKRWSFNEWHVDEHAEVPNDLTYPAILYSTDGSVCKVEGRMGYMETEMIKNSRRLGG